MKLSLKIFTVVVLGACVHTEESQSVDLEPPHVAVHSGTTNAAGRVPSLPDGWEGTGVLAQATYPVPNNAPEWTRTAAQVKDQDGKRYLVTVGHARGINNEHLARTTAVARARAELARWTGESTVVGSTEADVYLDESGIIFARVELQVPSNWQPGQSLTPVGER